MQKENQFFTPVAITSPEAMAQKFNLSKDFIVNLCKHDLLQAHYDQAWTILEDQKLPCVIEFKDVANDDNHSILKGDYNLVDLEGGYTWTECLLENPHYVEFQNICIDRGVFEDAQDYLHFKYVIEVEQYLQVSSWDNPLDKILADVDYAMPSTSRFVGVFETELEAYVYASKMYAKVGINDKVKLKYFEMLFFGDVFFK